jgi:predicted RNase H-like HicB family nuclease
MRKYLIIFEKTDTGYGAYAPDLPGLGVTGRTKQEAEEMIYEGIQFHIEALLEEGLPIPEAITEGEMLLIPA